MLFTSVVRRWLTSFSGSVAKSTHAGGFTCEQSLTRCNYRCQTWAAFGSRRKQTAKKSQIQSTNQAYNCVRHSFKLLTWPGIIWNGLNTNAKRLISVITHNMLRLVLFCASVLLLTHCQHFCSQAFQPHSLSLSHLSIHCPQQKPTQLPRLPISHKGTMLAQPTARRWGVVRRESSFHVHRGCSHTGAIFTHVYLDAFAALFVQRRSELRLAADRFSEI